jgi:hypothetical protein
MDFLKAVSKHCTLLCESLCLHGDKVRLILRVTGANKIGSDNKKVLLLRLL